MASATSLSSPERHPSLRLRIAISLAALAMLAILSMAVTLVMAMNESQEEFIDAELSSQIAYSMRVWHESPSAATPNTPDMHLYRIAGHGIPEGDAAAVPPAFASLPLGNHEIRLDGREHHVAVREDDSGRYILAYDVENSEVRERALLLSVVATALAVGLSTLIAGYVLAGHLTRQLDRLASAVSSGAQRPLEDAALDRELLPLARALDAYRQQQALIVERERAFAANLSHEIRTPLTGIRTDAELLTTLPGLPQAANRRASRIIDSVDRIETLAASLLLLAREAVPATQERTNLREAIAATWANLIAAAPKPLTLEIEVAPGTLVVSDPALLGLVLRNVLENALRHSDNGAIACRLDGTRLAVVDSGAGFSAAEIAHVFDRFFIGSRGVHGLGLALVRHVCEACGWTAEARNTASGHGEVVIDFAGTLRRD